MSDLLIVAGSCVWSLVLLRVALSIHFHSSIKDEKLPDVHSINWPVYDPAIALRSRVPRPTQQG
jgi:hypothetical protein